MIVTVVEVFWCVVFVVGIVVVVNVLVEVLVVSWAEPCIKSSNTKIGNISSTVSSIILRNSITPSL